MKIIASLTLIITLVSGSKTCLLDCCQSLTPSRPSQNYTYYQSTGHFLGGTGDWHIDTYGYSGQKDGYMNPAMQCVVNTGPLPAALYKLGYCKDTMHQNPPLTKPCSFYLDPQEPEKMCGRNDFFVHGCQCCSAGDTWEPPIGGCSAGCVIISLDNRMKLRVGDFVQVIQYEDNKD